MSDVSKSKEISRRKFHGRLVTIGAVCITGGLFPSLRCNTQVKSRSEYPKSRFVDVHIHMGNTSARKDLFTAETLLKWMDEHDVSQAVVQSGLTQISRKGLSDELYSEYQIERFKEHPDRLFPFCYIHPDTPGNHQDLINMLNRYINVGAVGFGEHKPGEIAIDDPRNMRLYEACAEVKLPVLFHLDTRNNIDEIGLPGMARVLKAVPECIFIGHGPGWWASISGDVKELRGYPKGVVTSGGVIDALMDRFTNLYADLSANSGANAISRDLEFGINFLIRRADRILFGTDTVRPEQKYPHFELFGQMDLPEEVQSKIFRDNARKLLKLSQ